MNREKLIEAVGCSESNADRYLEHLSACMDCYEIDTPKRQAAFLAQIGHESGSFTITQENMNYSESRLLEIFPKHFTADQAKDYARQPERIGSRAYADRMGNGPESSGDGYRYRGRGLIQLTGKDDYAECGKALGIDLLRNPELLKEPQAASMSAGWEWERSKLNEIADLGDFKKLTVRINGGLNGYADRCDRWAKAKLALGA